MNYLSIYFLFISILIVNSAKYDLESYKNSFRSVLCELNCLNKDDPSNVAKILNFLRNQLELRENFIEPTIEYCKKWNSNLLDNIKTNDDLSENFKTSFNQHTNILKKEIDDIIEKAIGFNLTNYRIENKPDLAIDLILKVLKYSENFISTVHNFDNLTIYKELQNCEVEYSGSNPTSIKFKIKVIKVESGKIVKNYTSNLNRSINSKKFEKMKYQLLNSESDKKKALNRYCLEVSDSFESYNINKEEYCNQ